MRAGVVSVKGLTERRARSDDARRRPALIDDDQEPQYLPLLAANWTTRALLSFDADALNSQFESHRTLSRNLRSANNDVMEIVQPCQLGN